MMPQQRQVLLERWHAIEREVAPAAEPWESEGEQDESDELHVEQSAQGAHALGGETREKIGAAPGQRRQDAQQNSHDGLGGLA